MIKGYEKTLYKDRLQDMINRGLRLEKPSKVTRNVSPPKLTNISNLMTSSMLESSKTFRLDGIGSKTMQNNSPRGGFSS